MGFIIEYPREAAFAHELARAMYPKEIVAKGISLKFMSLNT